MAKPKLDTSFNFGANVAKAKSRVKAKRIHAASSKPPRRKRADGGS